MSNQRYTPEFKDEAAIEQNTPEKTKDSSWTLTRLISG